MSKSHNFDKLFGRDEGRDKSAKMFKELQVCRVSVSGCSPKQPVGDPLPTLSACSLLHGKWALISMFSKHPKNRNCEFYF